jgi:type II secretory pathway component PulF
MTMPSGSLAPLRFQVRADLFGQLAAMEEAGLPFDQVLEALPLPPGEDARLKATRTCIRLGLGIAEAGLRGGLFTPLEASMVRTATLSGSPARTYRLIAAQCARRAARLRALKSRMTVPAIMIAVWILLGPVPNLVAGSLTMSDYLVKHLLPWIVAGAATYLLLDFSRRRQPGAGSPWAILLDGVLPLVPLFGPMEVRRNLRNFFDSLALLLEAGMPILQALPVALDTVRNQALRSQLAQIKPRIEAGTSFEQALTGLSLFGRVQAYELIRAGEASGALPRTLLRYSETETAAIDRFDDLVVEWIPRLAYTSTALLIGYGMIHGGAFMPTLPQQLR